MASVGSVRLAIRRSYKHFMKCCAYKLKMESLDAEGDTRVKVSLGVKSFSEDN